MTTSLPEAPESEAEKLGRTLAALSDRLPPRWTMTAQQDRLLGYGRADAVWRITNAFERIDTLVVSTLRRATDGGLLRLDLPLEVLSETLPAIVQAVFIAGVRGRSASRTVTTLLLQGAAPAGDSRLL